ncbi:hypothetical protein Clacol_010200 [Clathrus columnatus]|uniref:DUF6699 domain-containing protein n=1 Tax=Clathrus columnatus TaxID=1419009 RepID=A0AAV5AUD8_9AGAM|nr:hypothetical protein Clacol_010200 [Clathrus columnatus]
MKNGGHHQSKSFIHRWLSRTNNHANDVPSDEESERSINSPPPLTESSSTTDSSSFPPPTPGPVRKVVVSTLKPVKPIPIHPVIQRANHETLRPRHHSRPSAVVVAPQQENQNHRARLTETTTTTHPQPISNALSTINFPTRSDAAQVQISNSSSSATASKQQPHAKLDVGHFQKPAVQLTRPHTPRLKGTQPARLPSSRVKTPWTPPSRTIMLPEFDEMTPKARNVLSLPPNSLRPPLPVIALHPLVAHHPSRRTLMWDMVLPLKYIQKYSTPVSASTASRLLVNHLTSKPLYGCSRLSTEELSEYITNPPQPRIRIVSDLFRWSIDVYAQSVLPNDPKSFLTIQEVLYFLFEMTRHSVSDSEFQMAPSRFKEQLTKARGRRLMVRNAMDIAAVEQKKGLRRIDYLLDMTMFAGFERRESDVQDDLLRNDGFTTLFLKLDPHWS